MRDWLSFNADVIAEFRANGGVVGRFGGLPLVIVHTFGAKTGAIREFPLIPVFEDDRMLLFGTAQGAPADPAWCFNLRANPRVRIELGDEQFVADVNEVPADEAADIVGRRAATTPQLADYVASAGRPIPVFEVTRIDE